MKKILKKGKRGNRKERLVAYEEMLNLDGNSTRIELIQMLIPLGLQAVEEELQSEVMKIAGARYTLVRTLILSGGVGTMGQNSSTRNRA